MRILAIDDDQVALGVLNWILAQDGHEVLMRSHPVEAIQDILPGIDLVVSDVNMPVLDGFDIAQLVAGRIGTAPPRTLLISGEDHHARVARIPADQIIGLLDKPISLGHMHRIVRLIAQTRDVCPGGMGPFCSLRSAAVKRGDMAAQPWSRYCQSRQYAQCPFYHEHAGRALRSLVQNPQLNHQP